MTFGDRIRLIRGNLSQDEFANMLGSSRNVVSRWECENIIPKGSIILRIFEVFNVNINWLLSDKGEPYIDDLDRLDEKQTSFEKLDKRINGLEKQVQELANKIDNACDLIKKRFTNKMDI